MKVDYVTGGQDAFDMLCSAREAGCPYDMILLDWKMPQLDGLETARLIREKYSDEIPVLLLTACDWSDIEQEAVDKFEASQPGDHDLILMDAQMPVLDGRLKQLEEPEKAGNA